MIVNIKLIYFAAVDCGNLPDPTNGRVVLSGTIFRSTATYQCFSGYTISGTETRTCQDDGEWSGVAPTCIRELTLLGAE